MTNSARVGVGVEVRVVEAAASIAARSVTAMTSGSKARNSPARLALAEQRRRGSPIGSSASSARMQRGAVVGPGVGLDLDDRPDGGRVLGDELEVRLDVGRQLLGAGAGGAQPLAHVLGRLGQHRADDRPDQLGLVVEVVGDQPGAADPGALGDPRERGVAVAQLGDRVDRGSDDLSPPGGGRHRVVYSHE